MKTLKDIAFKTMNRRGFDEDLQAESWSKLNDGQFVAEVPDYLESDVTQGLWIRFGWCQAYGEEVAHVLDSWSKNMTKFLHR